MRAVLAIAAALLVLATAAAPHAHAGELGTHGCAACVSAGGERAEAASSEVAPRPVVWAVVLPESLLVAAGAPLGAVPGQSPPADR